MYSLDDKWLNLSWVLYLTILFLHFFTDFSQSDHSFIFKKELHVLSKDGLYKYEEDPARTGVNNFKKLYDLDLSQIPRERFDVQILKDQIFIINRKGGLVYKIDSDTIVRIDNSFAHKNQTGSKIFQINDTIYKYGGYGYWQTQDLITYYDFRSNEWEILDINQEITGLVDAYTVEKDNIIYFFGGTTVDKKHRKNVLKNYNIYSFDLKTRKLNFYGKMKYNFNSSYNTNISLNKKTHIIYRNDSIFHLNLLENKIKIYKTNSFHDRLVTGNNLKTIYMDSTFHAFNIYPHDDHFSFIESGFSSKKNLTNVIEFQRVDHDFFLQTPILEEPVLLNNSYKKYFHEFSQLPPNYKTFFLIIIFLFFICAIIISFFTISRFISSTRLKQSNSTSKIFLDSLILKYGKDSMKLNQIEQQILLLLSQRIKITGNEIKEMFDQTLNYSHIMRSKKQTIDNLNFKLKTLTKSEQNLINMVTSSIDKRIKEYMLIEKFQIISDKSSV